MPINLEKARQSLAEKVLKSDTWAEVVRVKLSAQVTKEFEATQLIQRLNARLAMPPHSKALCIELSEHARLWPYVFDTIVSWTLGEVDVSNEFLDSFILQLWAVKTEFAENDPIEEATWKKHLEHGDLHVRQDVGYGNTELWANDSARALLHQIAFMAAQPPHKISLGTQTKIKKIIEREVMAAVRQPDYDPADGVVREGIAKQIFMKCVLKNDRDETRLLTSQHGGVHVAPSRPLQGRRGFDSWMTQEEVDRAFPRFHLDSFERMATYNSGNPKSSRELLLGETVLPAILKDPKKKHIFIPVCDNTHWRAVYIKKLDDKEQHYDVTLFDSEGPWVAMGLRTHIEALFDACGIPKANINYHGFMDLVKQTDASSCGYYVTAFAHHVVSDIMPDAVDATVATSLEKGQGAIRKAVIQLHDARLVTSHGVGGPSLASHPYLMSEYFNRKVRSPVFPSLSGNVQKAPLKELTAKTPETILYETLGLRVKRTPMERAVNTYQIDSRKDLIAVRTEIYMLKLEAEDWFSIGKKDKADALQLAYDAYLKKADVDMKAKRPVSMSILEDENVVKVVDSFRYFGFFHKTFQGLTNKQTSTRENIEKEINGYGYVYYSR